MHELKHGALQRAAQMLERDLFTCESALGDRSEWIVVDSHGE